MAALVHAREPGLIAMSTGGNEIWWGWGNEPWISCKIKKKALETQALAMIMCSIIM